MPTRLPPCPQCHDNLFVRQERILSGRNLRTAYYCGRCNSEWHVPDATPVAPEIEIKRDGAGRRRVSRR